MESLAQAFAQQLLAVQHQEWDWSDGWSDGYGFNPHINFTTLQAGSSKPLGEDFSLSLPDELLEKILALLPVSYRFRAGAVCRRWNSITTSKRFLSLCEEKASSGPWYFMYKESPKTEGLVYDPGAKKWHSFTLPFIKSSAWFVAASDGLVCFADNSNGYGLYICNPMTKTWRKIPEPSQRWCSDYYAVSMTVDKISKLQTTVVARSSQMPDDYSRWTLSIEVCNSASQKWRTMANTILNGWRGGENSVICNGIFYCVIHSTAMVGSRDDECRHGLASYELSSGSLEVAFMPMPCPLTCVKLMNCNEKLIMVGGIGKSDVVRGIGIWELGKKWTEISRMPNKFFRGFGEFDDVFSSSGTGDLIYIHAFGSPQLLLFGMQHQSWRWSSQKCPMVKKHPLHLFTGFCFEPRLDACPWSTWKPDVVNISSCLILLIAPIMLTFAWILVSGDPLLANFGCIPQVNEQDY